MVKLMKSTFSLALVALLVFSCQSRRPPLLYPVKENEAYGYINASGEPIVPPTFLQASDFAEGYALVKDADSTLAYLDAQGGVTPLPADVDLADLPSEGLARAVKNGLVGYLTIPQLDWQIEPRWRAAGRFSQGLASVLLPEGRAGYINPKGELVFSLEASALGAFSHNRAWFVRDSRFGLIDRKGNELVPPQYSWLGDFHEGLARARTEEGRYGFLDLNGDWQIKPRFSRAGDFSENKALVYDSRAQQYGYIDATGQLVIDAEFLDGGPFHNGRAWVKQGRDFHYINARGEQVADLQLLEAGNFKGTLAQARDENGALYLDRENRVVWHSSFSSSTVTQSVATT